MVGIRFRIKVPGCQVELYDLDAKDAMREKDRRRGYSGEWNAPRHEAAGRYLRHQ